MSDLWDEIEVIARHRRGGETAWANEYGTTLKAGGTGRMTLWTSGVPAISSCGATIGHPVDRENAIEMVRDMVSGRGGVLKVWLNPDGLSTDESVPGLESGRDE